MSQQKHYGTDAEIKQRAIRALAVTHLFQNGMKSPNQANFDSYIGRMLLHPNFHKKGITLRHMREVFLELCMDVLED